jgi:hypothetical protein
MARYFGAVFTPKLDSNGFRSMQSKGRQSNAPGANPGAFLVSGSESSGLKLL